MNNEKQIEFFNQKLDNLLDYYPKFVKKNKIKASVISALFVCVGVFSLFQLETAFALSETALAIPTSIGMILGTLCIGAKVSTNWLEQKDFEFYQKISALRQERDSYHPEFLKTKEKHKDLNIIEVNEGTHLTLEDIKETQAETDVVKIHYNQQMAEPEVSDTADLLDDQIEADLINMEVSKPKVLIKR